MFITHSGRQWGAFPKYPDAQVHTGVSPFLLQTEFGPQGVGKQGSLGVFGSSTGSAITTIQRWKGSPVIPEGQLQIGL